MAQSVEELNGKDISGHELYVGRAQKKAERQAELKEKFEKIKSERLSRYHGVNLYVKNLDDTINDDKLHEEFAAFGNITSAKVVCLTCHTAGDDDLMTQSVLELLPLCDMPACYELIHYHTTTVLRPFFRDHLDEPVPEENFWTLWCKGRLLEADTPTIWLGITPFGLTSAHLHHPPYFLQAGCPFCCPANSIKALKATSAFGLGRRC